MLILHLSDLHFGAHSRFRELEPGVFAEAFLAQLEASREQLRIAAEVALVIVTGDLVETGHPREFEQAGTFLSAVVDGLGLPRRRTILVPGNHDVSWLHCKKVELDQELDGFDDDELRRRLDETKLLAYQEFTARFYGEAGIAGVATQLEAGALLYRYPEQRLVVGALNSCERESHRSEDHIGLIGRSQAKSMMEALRTCNGASWLRMLAVHHNPDVTAAANLDALKVRLRSELADGAEVDELIARYEADALGFEGRERLKAIAEDCAVRLVLHGHHHARDDRTWNGGRCHVLSAGSLALAAGKLPRDEPASLRLIQIAPEASEIRSWCLTYAPQARVKGQVERGAFTPDQAEPDGRSFILAPAEEFRTTRTGRTRAGRGSQDGTASWFLDAYRRTFRHQFLRWDLSMLGVSARPSHSPQEVAANLDEMYQPLRLASGFDAAETDRGEPLSPETLLMRHRPLIIRGLAGSGKTTWVRWTFRRLVDHPNALPLVLVLRDLAPQWRKGRGSKRRITRFLADKLSERLDGNCEAALRRALGAEAGPRPVLLVDGWDELGQLGNAVREGLQSLMGEFPRLLAVVTSRPFGVTRPSHAEGFAELDIQPLSDLEIVGFADRFFSSYHRLDTGASFSASAQFRLSLARSDETRELARTPLLLTMLLLLSTRQRLPDKRHLLYEDCIESLLTHSPQSKADEGALDARDHWCPADSEERWQVVAHLARTLQEEGYASSGFTSPRNQRLIGAPADWLITRLPTHWRLSQRRGFLRWLVERAGVMIDRADDRLEFVHLSFQEYLAAWDIEVDVRSESVQERRISTFLEYPDWWETLRLFAAIRSGRSRPQLQRLLRWLVDSGGAAQGLAGAMLADGLGDDALYRAWARAYSNTLAHELPEKVDLCLQAWAVSSQSQRRQALAERFAQRASESSSWLGWLRLRNASLAVVGQPIAGKLPKNSLPGIIVDYLDSGTLTNSCLAAGRFFCGGFPLWPGNPPEVALLHVWPGERRTLGMLLQALAAGGATERTLVAVSSSMLDPAPIAAVVLAEARKLARHWARELASQWEGEWARTLASELALYWARYWARDAELESVEVASALAREVSADWFANWVPYFAGDDWAKEWARGMASGLGYDLAREWCEPWTAIAARSFDLGFARAFARTWTSSRQIEWDDPGVGDFALIECKTIAGKIASRAAVASLVRDRQGPLSRLLAVACRDSLVAGNPAADLEAALDEAELHQVDGLWLALARHLVGRSNGNDRDLLIDRVAKADRNKTPLGWGLRYIVRGDILLDGGRVITLDELSDYHGLPRLPFLGELPDGLDVDWEEEAAEGDS